MLRRTSKHARCDSYLTFAVLTSPLLYRKVRPCRKREDRHFHARRVGFQSKSKEIGEKKIAMAPRPRQSRAAIDGVLRLVQILGPRREP